MYTPFPEARLSALITIGKDEFSKKFLASFLLKQILNFAVGILNF